MNKQLVPRNFFVVIHAQSFRSNTLSFHHVLESARIAVEAGADGVFLIPDYANEKNNYSKMATTEDLFLYFREIKKVYPLLWVGVNFLYPFRNLSSDTVDAIKEEKFDMIQSDRSFENFFSFEEMGDTEFFTGLAFKYTKYENATGTILKDLCNKLPEGKNIVATTSGPATGQAASLEKIKEIRSYLPNDKRLGLASGITIENVDSYLEAGVTDFLVATSLIQENKEGFDILDPEKVRQMADKIKG